MTIRRINQTSVSVPQRVQSKVSPKAQDTSQIKDKVTIGSKEDTTAPKKKWTIMHYSAADNNLTSYLVKDVNEMEAVGSTNTMNIIVQLDKGGKDCKRYYLKKDGNMYEITSPVIKDMGQVNMSDPKVLADFIASTMKKYPAEHYALIISDHGGGWKGAVEDDSDHGWMTTPDIRKALDMAEKETGKKLDVLGFDACLMSTTEVAYEMKDHVKYLVASEQTEGANGWPYTPLLTKKTLQKLDRSMRGKLDLTPEEFAKKMVEAAEGDQGTLPTMAATDLSKMKKVADATNLLAAHIILSDDSTKSTLKSIARKTQSFYGLKDQYHFAEQITKDESIKDEKLKKAAKALMDALKEAVIAEQHSSRYPNAHGLTAEIPSWGGVGKGYTDLKYAENTLWDEAMNSLNTKA